MSSDLRQHLDAAALRRLAGAQSYERGMRYHAEERVSDLAERAGVLSATVFGSSAYDVTISTGRKGIRYECSCPMGDDGAFCKHCVAVALAWTTEPPASSRRPRKKAQTTMADVRANLRAMDKDALVDLLVEAANESDTLHRALMLKAAKQRPSGIDLDTFRDALRDAIEPDDFVPYAAMPGYVRDVDRVIDDVAALFDDGHAAEVIGLAEFALVLTEYAIQFVDDSDGYMSEVLERLQALHLAACRKARPDGEALAKRLFVWETEGDWDTFSGASATYASVLGAKGLAEYRRLAAGFAD